MEYYKNLSLESLFYINENGLICEEEWKNIPDYIGIYKASNLGRIKSLDRNTLSKNKINMFHKGIVLKQNKQKNGYLEVGIRKNSKQKTKGVHILIAITFLNHIPCGHKLVVDHKFENKLDNRASMLQIITLRENSSKSTRKVSSKYTGVYLDATNSIWRAEINSNGKKIRLGSFNSEEEASIYYKNALFSHNNNLPIKIKTRKRSSIYRGVYICRYYNKWYHKIIKNGKSAKSGGFKTEYEAHKSYELSLLNL